MTRHYVHTNTELPTGVLAIVRTPPACFERRIWELYVDEAWRETLNDRAARVRMERGQRPDHCSDCTAAYRERMEAQGRCQPVLRREVANAA